MQQTLKSRISPPVAQPGVNFSAASAKDKVVRNEEKLEEFRNLIMESNSAVQRERAAKGTDDLASAKSSEEFFERLREGADQNKPQPPSSEMDKDAFLKLFIAQLQNQDPLQPKDSSEMASQMAQFQSLESSMNINKTLETLVKSQSRNQAVSLVDFVGKEINIKGGRLKITDGKLQDAVMNLDKDAASTVLEVRNGSGAVVAEQALGNLSKGKHEISFNGLDKEGNKLPDGVYTFAVVAKDGESTSVPVEISSSVKVTGVNLQDEGGSFFTELGSVSVTEIDSVGTAGFMRDEIEKMKADKATAAAKKEETAAQPAGADQQAAQNSTGAAAPKTDSPEQPPPEIREQAMKAAQAMMQGKGPGKPPAG